MSDDRRRSTIERGRPKDHGVDGKRRGAAADGKAARRRPGATSSRVRDRSRAQERRRARARGPKKRKALTGGRTMPGNRPVDEGETDMTDAETTERSDELTDEENGADSDARDG